MVLSFLYLLGIAYAGRALVRSICSVIFIFSIFIITGASSRLQLTGGLCHAVPNARLDRQWTAQRDNVRSEALLASYYLKVVVVLQLPELPDLSGFTEYPNPAAILMRVTSLSVQVQGKIDVDMERLLPFDLP